MIRAILISVGFGLLGLALVLWWLGEDLSSAWRVPAWAYAIGLALAALNYVAGALRIMLLARTAGSQLRFVVALRAYAVGLFSGAVTPGSAGQAPAMVLSLVSDGFGAARAWRMAVRVWVLDLIFLAWSVPLSVLLLGQSSRFMARFHPELLAAALFIGSTSIVLILIFRLHWLTAAAAYVLKLPGLRRWRSKSIEFMARVDKAGRTLWSAPLQVQVRLHLYSMVIYLSTYLTFWVVVESLRPGAKLLLTMAGAQVPMVLASFFPTPGGSGLLEVLTASLMRSGHAAAAILAWRLLTFYLRMLVGPVLGWQVLTSARGALRPHASEAADDKANGGDSTSSNDGE